MAHGAGDMLRVETPESVAFTYELAGLGSRGLAAALDLVVLAAVLVTEALLVVLVLYLTGSLSASALESLGPWAIALLIAVLFVTVWGYFIGGEAWGRGRTVGKRALGLRVVRDDGSRIAGIDAVIRNVVRIVDLLPGSYAIGIISVVLSRENKRLGDYAAGTVVVREGRDDALPVSFDELAERGQLVADYLARRESLTPPARLQVASALLEAYGERPAGGETEDAIVARLVALRDAEGRAGATA